MENKSVVAEWYKGRSIFITGATGFMGKVLIEKLLHACSDVGTLYVLMRPKRGKTQQQRLKDMFALPVFDRIRTVGPKLLEKVVPINGELTMDNLGISPHDRQNIIDNVSIVFHFAATLRLEAELIDSLEMNTAGTQRVIELSKEIKNLKAFVHISTTFCSPDVDVFEEKVYDAPADPLEVMKTAKWMSKEALVRATPEIIKPHVNTYTYTKRLAETLVANEAKNMRVTIVRPSVVTPAGIEPIPGWVDSLNGPMGILVAAAKGVLRVMNCVGEYEAYIVPVDMAINAIIVIAWKRGSSAKQPEEIPVYNLTNAEVLKVTWAEIFTEGKKIGHEYPFEMQVWYPEGTMVRNYWVYFIWSIFVHWIPAILIDILLFIFRQERIMIRVQRKIYNGLELLQFFTTRKWEFRSTRFHNLVNNLNDFDKKVFYMDYMKVPRYQYLEYCVLGAREFCMKENIRSLKRCRRQLSVLYIVDKLFKMFLLYGIFCLAYSCSKTVKHIYDSIEQYFRSIMLVPDGSNGVLNYTGALRESDWVVDKS